MRAFLKSPNKFRVNRASRVLEGHALGLYEARVQMVVSPSKLARLRHIDLLL